MPLLVLLWLEAKKRDSPDLVPGAALLTVLSVAGRVWRFALEAIQTRSVIFGTRLAAYPAGGLSSLIRGVLEHIQYEPQTEKTVSHVLCHGEGDLTSTITSLSGKCGCNEIDVVWSLCGLNEMMCAEQLAWRLAR